MGGFDQQIVEEKAEALATFEKFNHELAGDIEVDLYVCFNSYTMRCRKCNWFWSYQSVTGDLNGPDDKQPSPFCTK